ncbi:3-methyladenine DNA glycosylase [Rhodococcus sp. NPDC056743]|uniref:3-methyladenine DNA glycosylase n=1 Tax=Rhodococcus sp. NPDC056743 TaxID=3345934 RepID=UPI00366F84AC
MTRSVETLALSRSEWTARQALHFEKVEQLVGPHRARRSAGITHPVHDFLFTYYNFKPAQLRRWHPGYSVALEGASEYAEFSGYRVDESGYASVDPSVLDRRRHTVEFVGKLLDQTSSRPAVLGCFGLHEWAMVYRGDEEAIRHQSVPLRLGSAGTDAVVESLPLKCTHYDAFRFFTPDAAPKNALNLIRDTQIDYEQPGCLHAGMDLYKWSFKLLPLVDSDLVMACFEHALLARELDMRASPYDLREYGYSPIAIETPAGRAEYVRQQQQLAERAAPLRATLAERCRDLLGH